MPRITVKLLIDEREALLRLAQQERRDPRAQAALIIRRELEREGLLSPSERGGFPPTGDTEEAKSVSQDA